MPKTVVYAVNVSPGGQGVNGGQITIPANGTIIGLAISFVAIEPASSQAVGVEVTKNIPAGGTTPVVQNQTSPMREYFIGAAEFHAVGSASVSDERVISGIGIPVRTGDIVNVGTYWPSGFSSGAAIAADANHCIKLYVHES